jgi:hypothetical protein
MNALRSEASGTRSPEQPFSACSPHGIEVPKGIAFEAVADRAEAACGDVGPAGPSTTLLRITLPVAASNCDR